MAHRAAPYQIPAARNALADPNMTTDQNMTTAVVDPTTDQNMTIAVVDPSAPGHVPPMTTTTAPMTTPSRPRTTGT